MADIATTKPVAATPPAKPVASPSLPAKTVAPAMPTVPKVAALGHEQSNPAPEGHSLHPEEHTKASGVDSQHVDASRKGAARVLGKYGITPSLILDPKHPYWEEMFKQGKGGMGLGQGGQAVAVRSDLLTGKYNTPESRGGIAHSLTNAYPSAFEGAAVHEAAHVLERAAQKGALWDALSKDIPPADFAAISTNATKDPREAFVESYMARDLGRPVSEAIRSALARMDRAFEDTFIKYPAVVGQVNRRFAKFIGDIESDAAKKTSRPVNYGFFSTAPESEPWTPEEEEELIRLLEEADAEQYPIDIPRPPDEPQQYGFLGGATNIAPAPKPPTPFHAVAHALAAGKPFSPHALAQSSGHELPHIQQHVDKAIYKGHAERGEPNIADPTQQTVNPHPMMPFLSSLHQQGPLSEAQAAKLLENQENAEHWQNLSGRGLIGRGQDSKLGGRTWGVTNRGRETLGLHDAPMPQKQQSIIDAVHRNMLVNLPTGALQFHGRQAPGQPYKFWAQLHNRDLVMDYLPENNAFKINFMHRGKPMASTFTVGREVQKGSKDFLTSLRGIVDGIKQTGSNITYEADQRHRNFYRRVLPKLGYTLTRTEPIAKSSVERDLWEPTKETQEPKQGLLQALGMKYFDPSQPRDHLGMWTDNELRARIDRAALDTDTNPSEDQKKAGNYRKGRVTVQGLEITIETPKGAWREGKDKYGLPWRIRLGSHYGYIRGRGVSEADGDHHDVFLGPNPESELVFVIDQIKPGGRFDELKTMLGYTNEKQAKAAYLDSYSKGWKGFGGITAMTMDAFKRWIEDGDTSKRVSGQVLYADVHYGTIPGVSAGGGGSVAPVSKGFKPPPAPVGVRSPMAAPISPKITPPSIPVARGFKPPPSLGQAPHAMPVAPVATPIQPTAGAPAQPTPKPAYANEFDSLLKQHQEQPEEEADKPTWRWRDLALPLTAPVEMARLLGRTIQTAKTHGLGAALSHVPTRFKQHIENLFGDPERLQEAESHLQGIQDEQSRAREFHRRGLPYADSTRPVRYAELPTHPGRQGPSNPTNPGALARAGTGYEYPSAAKPNIPEAEKITGPQPPQFMKELKPPTSLPQQQEPQVHPLEAGPVQANELGKHLATHPDPTRAAVLALTGHGWNGGSPKDHTDIENHLGNLNSKEFWKVAQMAGHELHAQATSGHEFDPWHAGVAQKILHSAAAAQPPGPTVSFGMGNTEMIKKRGRVLDMSAIPPLNQIFVHEVLNGLPKVKGVQDSYVFPAGFDVQKFLGPYGEGLTVNPIMRPGGQSSPSEEPGKIPPQPGHRYHYFNTANDLLKVFDPTLPNSQFADNWYGGRRDILQSTHRPGLGTDRYFEVEFAHPEETRYHYNGAELHDKNDIKRIFVNRHPDEKGFGINPETNEPNQRIEVDVDKQIAELKKALPNVEFVEVEPSEPWSGGSGHGWKTVSPDGEVNGPGTTGIEPGGVGPIRQGNAGDSGRLEESSGASGDEAVNQGGPGGSGPADTSNAGGISSEEVGKRAKSLDHVSRKLMLHSKRFLAKGDERKAGWMDALHEHINDLGPDKALEALGEERKGPGAEVQYEGAYKPGDFLKKYLASSGTSVLQPGAAADPSKPVISSLPRAEGAMPRRLGDFVPAHPAYADKLEEAKHLAKAQSPELEPPEDINKVVGEKVTRFTPEVVAKLDEKYGKGKWIVKSYGTEAFANYGIFFPEYVDQLQKDAKNTILSAERNIGRNGFNLVRSPEGGVVGVQGPANPWLPKSEENFGDKFYELGSEDFNKLDKDVRESAHRAAVATEHEEGAVLPTSAEDELRRVYKISLNRDADGKAVSASDSRGNTMDLAAVRKLKKNKPHLLEWLDRAVDDGPKESKFFVEPAHMKEGVTEADRRSGATWNVGTEGRVHAVTYNGNADVIPYASYAGRGDRLPIVFQTEDSKAMEKAVKDAIDAQPEKARSGQVYAPDVMKTKDGWKVIELNASEAPPGGGSSWFATDPFVMDALVSHMTGRDPAHVRFIRRLLAEK